MKRTICLVVILTTFANINIFSATKKFNSPEKKKSVQNQEEAVKIALSTVNSFLRKQTLSDGTVDYTLTSEEIQKWVYNNPRFTNDFKTEYSNYVAAINLNICDEDFDEVDGCRHFDDLEDEEKRFYDKHGIDPFIQGQDTPTGFKLVRYNEKDGYVIVKPESGDFWRKYFMYIKVVNEDGKWKVDGIGRLNIPKQFHVPF